MTAHAPTAPPARSWRLRVALGALVVVALAAAAWWVTSPSAVGEYPASTIGMTVPVGDTVLVDAAVYTDDDARISLVSAVPRVAENSAAADVDVVLCRRDGTGTDLVGTAFAASTSCEEMPIAGAQQVVPRTAQLIVRITPHQAGTVRIEGVDLTYLVGLQRGTVHTGTLIETSTD